MQAGLLIYVEGHNDHQANEALTVLRDLATGDVGSNLAESILRSQLPPEFLGQLPIFQRITLNFIDTFFANLSGRWEAHITGATDENSPQPGVSDNIITGAATSNAQPPIPPSTFASIGSSNQPLTMATLVGSSRLIPSSTSIMTQDASTSSMESDPISPSVPNVSGHLQENHTMSLPVTVDPFQSSASFTEGANLGLRLRSLNSGPSELTAQQSSTTPSALNPVETAPPNHGSFSMEDPSFFNPLFTQNYEDWCASQGNFNSNMN